MVITGRTITAVCKTNDWAKRYVGKETRVIDLEASFVLPGLIDAHVDFFRRGCADRRRPPSGRNGTTTSLPPGRSVEWPPRSRG